MKTLCDWSGVEFESSADDLDFYREFDVPVPHLSPTERFRRRLGFRHGGNLHRTKCDLTGKPIISMYAPTDRLKVYDQAAWWSDSWSALDYGRDFDFSKPFFEQFKQLYDDVPHIALLATNCENSAYTNHFKDGKNCYLLFGGAAADDSQYGDFLVNSRDVLDSASLYECELCYDGINSANCYGCISFTSSRNCTDCIVIEDCLGCSDCIACFGLRKQQYCILNEQVGKKRYLEYRKQLAADGIIEIPSLKQQLSKLAFELPHAALHIYNSEDCTGHMIFDSKNCHMSFDIKNSEDCKYIAFSPNSAHSRDCTFTAQLGVQYSYESVSTFGQEAFCCCVGWNVSAAQYCCDCHNVQNVFGCVGIRNAQFCIFNKQYSEPEWNALRGRIVEHMKQTGEWGDFFPAELSPFAYNDSMAQQFFPLSQEQAQARGFSWRKEDESAAGGGANLSISPRIAEVDDSILNEVLTCEVTGKKYRINAAELAFYRKTGLPIPRLSPDERRRLRMARRSSYNLLSRTCAASGKPVLSVYTTEQAKFVLCEEEYLKLI